MTPWTQKHGRVATAAALGLALAAGATDARAQDIGSDGLARSRVEFRAGMAAARGDQWHEALSAFTRAYALAPHFLVRAAARDAASADTAVEWMIARYAYQAERQRDGSWRISRLQINLDEIARSPGFFPGGQRNGR